MAFLLADDEDLIAKTVAEFARDQIGLDAAHERDRHDTFPDEALAAAAQLGLTGMALGEDEGGVGVSPTAYALAVMETAKVCPNTAAVLASHNGLGLRLLKDGPEAVRDAAVAGEIVATLATEEAHGSWKERLGTEADDGRLTGMKVWGVGAAGAKHLLVLAKAAEGPTFYHLPADTEGVVLGKPESLLGLRGAGIRTVYLSDARAEPVGVPGGALEAWRAAQPWLQVGVAATLVGATAGAFAAGREFAASRVQFGRPIGTYQAVSGTVTDIDLKLSAARSLCLEAAAHLGRDDAAVWAARAKAFAADMAVTATRQVIRVQGGTGFMREGGSERFARDVRALQFMGEPVVMQQDTLKRHLLDIEFEAAP